MSVPQLKAHEEEVILVGRTTTGELVVDSDFAQPVDFRLPCFRGSPVTRPARWGCTPQFLTIRSTTFSSWSTAADFQFILLAKDPGMEVWNYKWLRLWLYGNERRLSHRPVPVHTHPVWNIVKGTPGNAYC